MEILHIINLSSEQINNLAVSKYIFIDNQYISLNNSINYSTYNQDTNLTDEKVNIYHLSKENFNQLTNKDFTSYIYQGITIIIKKGGLFI